MTSLKLLEMYPFYSADSTSWKMCAAMGSIYTPYGTVYVSDRNAYSKDYILNQSPEAQRNIFKYLDKVGFSFEDVKNYDYNRYIVNIYYLLEWARNYKYKGASINKKSLF
jgi:hypothetical protein